MFNHIPRLLRLAGPMILSSSAITIMHLVDALVLSRYSGDAIAAMGPSSLAVILFQGFLFGTAGYAGTFVAHNHGRGDRDGIFRSTWLGIQTSLAAGILALITAWPLSRLFLLAGHSPQVTLDEISYFSICMAGSFFPVLSAALAGWLSGTGRTFTVTCVTFISLAVNAMLAWGLVLGRWGLPSMGISGAALATVSAQSLSALMFAMLFVRSGGLKNPAWRQFSRQELVRFLSLAAPLGLRISGELAAWTLFLVFVGRLGTVELAASSIAFRINGTAFFPALGLGQAAGILVGHARGAGKDDDVPAIAWQSLFVCEIWMVSMALLFAVASAPLVAIFAGTGPDSAMIVNVGSVIMKFVAFYCIFDAANVVIGCVLASAGETRWLARAFTLYSCLFLMILWIIDRTAPGLAIEWGLAVLFVFSTAAIWTSRFRSGAWRRIRVLHE